MARAPLPSTVMDNDVGINSKAAREKVLNLTLSKISRLLERIIVEAIDIKNSLDCKLQIYFICSIRIRSRKRDIVEKPLQHNSNPNVLR